MSSSWGTHIKLSIFGESHGGGIGAVLDGLPAGEAIDLDALHAFAKRRAPGNSLASTARKEEDLPEILSGLVNGITCGTPLAAVIRNTDTRSQDYRRTQTLARPGHADYTGYLRYGGHNDIRGGGHFSGRLTAPLVFAGGICKQILEHRGIFIGAHLLAIHGVQDSPFDPVHLSKEELLCAGKRDFPVLDEQAGHRMQVEIEKARLACDSAGGTIECAVLGLPAGVGSPMFDGVENILSSILFGIPAVKGLEFGEGFGVSSLFGSENNDAFYMDGEEVKTRTNRHGGILGGITSGMPLILRVAMKPTPSIAKEQQTIDYVHRQDASLSIVGRHDPCLAVRAVPCVEAAIAVGLLELLCMHGRI